MSMADSDTDADWLKVRFRVPRAYLAANAAGILRLRIDGDGLEDARTAVRLLRGLLAVPGLANLTHLALRGAVLGRAGAKVLVTSPVLPQLTSLDLRGCGIGPGGARLLAGSPQLANLTALDLSGNDIGASGALALAASPHLAGLSSLALAGNGLGTEGARALAVEALCMPEALSLGQNGIGAAGVDALAGSRLLARVRSLTLDDNPIRSEGAQALAGSPLLSRLASLGLAWCGVGPFGAEDLAGSPHLAALTTLDLAGNPIQTYGAQALAASPHLANLRSLVLDGTLIGDEGMAALAASPYLSGLAHLDLRLTALGPAGVRALVCSPNLTGLSTIVVDSTARGFDLALLRARFATVTQVPALPEEADALFEQARTGKLMHGGLPGVADICERLGLLAYDEGDYDLAMRMAGHTEDLRADLHDESGRSTAMCNLGHAYLARGSDNARSIFASSLTNFAFLEDRSGMPGALEGAAVVLAGADRHEPAARLLGAAEALRLATGSERAPRYQPVHDRVLADLEASLGPERLAAALGEGGAIPLADVVQLAVKYLYG